MTFGWSFFMNHYSVFEKVEEVFRRVVSPKEIINKDLKKGNVDNWDSLHHLILIAELESEFNISFSLEEINLVDSFQDLISIIEKKLYMEEDNGF